jgi:hypothetical protein
MSRYPDNTTSADFARIDALSILERMPGEAVTPARAAYAVATLAYMAQLHECGDRAMVEVKMTLGEHVDGDDILHGVDELANEMAGYNHAQLSAHVADEQRRLERIEKRRAARREALS